MIFNKHFSLPGAHAYLSASKYAWLNYDDDKFDRVFYASEAAKRGSELHALAHDLIRLGVRLPDNTKTLNQYVNDAIRYRMTPEQLLFVSEFCFGTPDAISFSEKRMKLRVSDLKTGSTPTSEKQLMIYAAMFCLEYGGADALDFKVFDVEFELRIYQSDEVRLYEPDPSEILVIVETIKTRNRRLQELTKEVA